MEGPLLRVDSGTTQAATARATAVTRTLTRIFMALFLQDAASAPAGDKKGNIRYGTWLPAPGTDPLVRPGGARAMPQREGRKRVRDARSMLPFGVIDL